MSANEEPKSTVSRRTIVKAAWTVPAVLVLGSRELSGLGVPISSNSLCEGDDCELEAGSSSSPSWVEWLRERRERRESDEGETSRNPYWK